MTISQSEAPGREITTTSATGEYLFAAVPAGRYTLEIRSPGFALFRRLGLEITPHAQVRQDATLQVGQVSETVNVIATGRAAPQPAGGPPRRIRVGGNVQATRLIHQVRPVYPETARQQGIEGTVLLTAVIAREGNLLSLNVVNTLVDPQLAQAALDAVRQWRYEPTLLNGEPVEVVTTITVNFHLAAP